MAREIDEGIVGDIARGLVAELAPHELPLLRATSAAYFKDPKAVRGKGKEDMLGFGLEGAATFLTPIILAVSSEVFDLLMGIARDALQAEGSDALRKAVRRLFKRSGPDDEDAEGAGVSLTAEQVAVVRERAFAKARQLDLPESQCALLADALAGSLAVGG